MVRRSPGSQLCSTCDGPRDRPGRNCLKCHAAYMREWRKTHPMTPEQRRKANARWYAKVYLRRGKIERRDCENCGSTDSQMHHPDYARPLFVIWLCRTCHLAEHAG